MTHEYDPHIPNVVANYVKWGDYDKLDTIINSGGWFPVYIAGDSGYGKTMMVQQACANTNRSYIRVQINPETDESDLIGSLRLKDGSTNFQKGPVIRAMEEGAILLLDEIDRGSNLLMCLQGILEGGSYLIKKTGEVICPKDGFNIFATANTNGQGDISGRYSSATILDDALLERFTMSMAVTPPKSATEHKILKQYFDAHGVGEPPNFKDLTEWAKRIRDVRKDGGIEAEVSTRRLCKILDVYSMFDCTLDYAIKMGIAKFDEVTKEAMLDLWQKMKSPDIGSKEDPVPF